MRKFFRKASTHTRQTRKKSLAYGTLEERRVLATTAAFIPATGVLTVTLSDTADTAVIDVAGDNVTLNGSAQILSGGVAGAVSANAITQITVNGSNAANQTVVLNGNFNDSAGRDLDNVIISNVNQVSVLGGYEINNTFSVTLDGTNGGVGDGPADGSGRLLVGGTTTINAGQNSIVLDNGVNNFNLFNGTTTGSNNNDIVVSDVNDIVFSGIQSVGDLVVVAGGNVSDTANADIVVGRDGLFTAQNVGLGSETQTTNFFRSGFTTTGTVDLQEDSNTILLSTTAQSLRVESQGAIFDGFTTVIDVAGLAELNGNNRIRLGDNGTDSFNAGSLTFVSNGHVSINERSGTTLVGESSALSWTHRSIGDVINGAGATIDIVQQTGLSAANVVLGTQAGDNFQTGALFFFATNRFELEADSDLIIIEQKNESGVLVLESTGTITDDGIAKTNIRGLARFTAASVDIGNTFADEFNAGSIEFDTETTFRLNENSSTNITNNSEAGVGSSIINSAGDITNSASATVDVEGAIGFFGDNILLGSQANDDFRFGVLTFNTAAGAAGLVDITEDNATLISGVNTATNARIQSAGAITDGQTSNVTVTSNTRFTTLNGDDITIGDSGDIFQGGVDTGNDFDAVFNTGSLTLDAQGQGDVFVEEDSVILLTGTSQTNDLTLVAGAGAASFNIGDSSIARTAVGGTLNVDGNLINLGTGVDIDTGEDTDLLTLAGLTFNTTGNTNISAESGFELRGSNDSDALLILNSGGQITAATDALFDVAGNVSLNDVDDVFDFVV